MLVAGNDAPKFSPLDAGTYPARVLGVADLGLQPMQAWRGEEKKPRRKLAMAYEFGDEFLVDDRGNEMKDKPRVVTETFPLYPLDSERAKSTQRYMVLDPSVELGGDFSRLVDLPVLVTVVQNPDSSGRVWNNVASISAMRDKDKDKVPSLINTPFVFDLDEPNMETFSGLFPWLQKVITSNLEYEGSVLQAMLKEGQKDLDDDNPF